MTKNLRLSGMLVVVGSALVAPSRAQVTAWTIHQGKASQISTTSDGVHIWQESNAESNDYSSASMRLAIPKNGYFTLSFRFRYGNWKAAGTSIEVNGSKGTLVRIHGDMWGGCGVLNGKTNGNWMPFSDHSWHTFEIAGSSNNMKLTVDGKVLSTFEADLPPNEIFVGTRNNVASQQTELDIGSIRIDVRNAPELDAERPVGASAPPPATGPGDLKRSPVDSRMVAVMGLNSRALAPAYPVQGERIKICARRSSIVCSAGETLEFQGRLEASDFIPVRTILVVDGKTLRTEPYFGKGQLPVMSYVPEKREGLADVRVFGEDDVHRRVELLACSVWIGKHGATGQFKLIGGTLSVSEAPADAKAAYVFLEDSYLGEMDGDRTNMTFEARRLPVGQHRFSIIYGLADGTLVEPVSSVITIKPRFKVDSVAQSGKFVAETWDSGIPFLAKSEDADISRVRVYVNGAIAGEFEPSFSFNIPTESLPSGKVIVDIIGMDKDGGLYAPEQVVLELQNHALDSMIARDERRRSLQKLIDGISQYDQDVVYWYERAILEPEFRTYAYGRAIYTVDEFGRMASIGYVESFTVAGNAEKYFAECKAAIVRRAEYRLKIGREQAAMGLKADAKSTFEQVIFEVGPESGLGTAARQELAKLKP
jgi:hypothetical protein